MALLTEAALKATMGDPMTPVQDQSPLPPDFWQYFDSVESSDLGGYDFGEGKIERAYRDPTGVFDHVLLASNEKDVFLVMVIDRRGAAVHGHHLLDLPRAYGLR